MGCVVTGRYMVNGFFAIQLLPHNSTWSCLLTKYLLKVLLKMICGQLECYRGRRGKKSLRTLENSYSRMGKLNTLRNEENWDKAVAVQFSYFPHSTISTHCAYGKIFSCAKISAWSSRKLIL